jgi:hypothetical protein
VLIHCEVCNNLLNLTPGDQPFKNVQHCHITGKRHLSAARACASCAASLPLPRVHTPVPPHPSNSASRLPDVSGHAEPHGIDKLIRKTDELTVKTRGWPVCCVTTSLRCR